MRNLAINATPGNHIRAKHLLIRRHGLLTLHKRATARTPNDASLRLRCRASRERMLRAYNGTSLNRLFGTTGEITHIPAYSRAFQRLDRHSCGLMTSVRDTCRCGCAGMFSHSAPPLPSARTCGPGSARAGLDEGNTRQDAHTGTSLAHHDGACRRHWHNDMRCAIPAHSPRYFTHTVLASHFFATLRKRSL